MNRCFSLIIGTVLTLVFSTNAAADSSSQCLNYLKQTDNTFYNSLSSAAAAANVAATLKSCEVDNLCRQFSDLEHCSALLATRTFVSTYYAGLNSGITETNAPIHSSSTVKKQSEVTSSATDEVNNHPKLVADKKTQSLSSSISWF